MADSVEVVIAPGGSIQLIHAKDLRFADYQPEHRRENVSDLTDNFRPEALENLTVSFRDGEYWVIEGSRRTTAALEVGYDKPLVCHVHYGLSHEREAELWGVLNRRRPQSAIDVYKAAVRAKVPRIAVKIDRQVREHGYVVDHHGGIGVINAVKALEVLELWGSLGNVLSILREAWPDEEKATSSEILMALGAFDQIFGTEYRKYIVVDVLHKDSPGLLMGKARAAKGDPPKDMYLGPSSWTAVLAFIHFGYNKKATKPDRLDRYTSEDIPKVPNKELVIARPLPGRMPKKKAPIPAEN